MKTKGLLVSHWENGITKVVAELDLESGHLFVDDAFIIGAKNGILKDEFFIDYGGDEYEICPICHKYILHDISDVDEFIFECSDIDCKYNDYGNTNDVE